MPKRKIVRELLVMAVTLIAIVQTGRAVRDSIQRQVFLSKQSVVLKAGQKQSEEINRELRDGLTSYRSSSGIERLARERLNLAGPNEIVVRLAR